jgi:Holliday junction DNA helicase RuvB
VVERAGDLAGILTNLQPRDVLFIDEIHRISKTVEEYLYSAMEDFTISIMIDQGAHARSVSLDVPRFTLIGATTREGLLTAALRSRFGVFERLEPYPPEDLVKIVNRSARLLDVKVEDAATALIAQRSRGTPRITNRFLRRIRDVAQVKSKGVVTLDIAVEGLKMLDVDECGLDGMDRKILAVLVRYKGAAVGLKTIAVTVGEEEDTIEEVYEPYLIQCGFLQKTPRGRVATERAYEHLGKKPPAGQGSLFQA